MPEKNKPTRRLAAKKNTPGEEKIVWHAQLLESEKLTGIGSFEWNLRNGDFSFSPRCLEIVGSPATDLAELLEYVSPLERTTVKTALEEAQKQKQDIDCEFRFTRNEKEKVLWLKATVDFSREKPARMRGTLMDITERNKALFRLRQQEELHKQAQKLTHIGTWSWDLISGKFICSDELYRIYGIEPQSAEISFEKLLSYIHPEDKETRRWQVEKALEMKDADDYITRIITPQGSIKVLQGKSQVNTDENNLPVSMSGTCQDITRDFILNKELKEREEYIRQLIFNAPDAVMVFDERAEVLLWNPKAENIFGWKMEEIIGKRISEIPGLPPSIETQLRLLINEGSGVLNKIFELSVFDKRKKQIHISLTVSASSQSGQKVFIAFMRDISEEKQIKSELQNKTRQLAELNLSLEQKNKELERSNKELTSFTYVASHDLQEPLRKIKTFTDLLVENDISNLSEDGKSYFDRITASALRMQKLIHDLLSFSRTQTTMGGWQEVDMNLLVEEIRKTFRESMKEKNVIIDAETLPVINAIPFQVQQLMENIIGNSVKYSKAGVPPRIRISAELVEGNRVGLVRADRAKKYHKISFEDNGIGFDQQHADKIFEVFQRLHGKNEYSGTGIGLAICKKIAENHSGFIEAKGRVNEGAVFEVYFPG
jgi:PAS domain S-box-containing protein